MAMIIMASVFWDVMPCSLEEINRYFGGMCYLHIHSTIWHLKDEHSALSDTSTTQPIRRRQKFWTWEI